jgi:hypothetical protein
MWRKDRVWRINPEAERHSLSWTSNPAGRTRGTRFKDARQAQSRGTTHEGSSLLLFAIAAKTQPGWPSAMAHLTRHKLVSVWAHFGFSQIRNGVDRTMTKIERSRVVALVRATEYLFLENLALKLVLENREVRNWRRLLDKLLADREILAGVHLRFADIYKEIEHSPNPCNALESCVSGLPCKKPS